MAVRHKNAFATNWSSGADCGKFRDSFHGENDLHEVIGEISACCPNSDLIHPKQTCAVAAADILFVNFIRVFLFILDTQRYDDTVLSAILAGSRLLTVRCDNRNTRTLAGLGVVCYYSGSVPAKLADDTQSCWI